MTKKDSLKDLVTCKQCGWVHFAVTQDYINKWAADWAHYCKTESEDWLSAYGIVDRQPPSAARYLQCFLCRGSYKNFRPAKAGDMPEGCTIQAILGAQ